VKSKGKKALQESDLHHLHAAQGWLGLRNYVEANKELEHIAPKLRTHPDVLDVRWHICAHSKKWERCVYIAAAITSLEPDRADGWIQCSIALHELDLTQEAFNQLKPVADRFPTVWTIPYNIACYSAKLGRLAESQRWLEQAIAIDKSAVKRAAIDDADLKPLWHRMGGTLWNPAA